MGSRSTSLRPLWELGARGGAGLLKSTRQMSMSRSHTLLSHSRKRTLVLVSSEHWPERRPRARKSDEVGLLLEPGRLRIGDGMSSESIKRILLVEDNLGDARLLREMLSELGSHHAIVTHVQHMRAAEQHLEVQPTDVILLDPGLPDAQGLESIRRAHAAAPAVPLVVLTVVDDDLLAVKALQAGAQHYLVKGQIEPRGLLRAMHFAIERKSMEDALFAEKERAEVTLKCIGDAVICTDIEGKITFLNLVAEKMTGWVSQAAQGRPLAGVVRILDATTREPIADLLEIVIREDRTVHLPTNCILIRLDQLEIAIEDSIAPIHDREGRPAGAVVVLRDVSAARSMARQMAHSAQHDFLTGFAQSNAAERSHQPGHRSGTPPRKPARRAVPGPRRLQAHQ